MAGLAPPLLRTLAACLLLTAGMISGALAQQRVGIDAAVNRQAAGTPPGGATKELIIGQNVVYNEHVTTGPLGQTQLLFLDESAMTIGPNSDVTIDRFVYDPNRGTGTLAMSAARGVLRFVGGKLSKREGQVTLATPAARMAIRGGGFIADIGAGGRTEAIFLNGRELTVTGLNGLSQTLLRPDFAVTVDRPGAGPSAPFVVPAERIANLFAMFDGRSGGHGGSVQRPTDAAVIGSGIARVISDNIAANIRAAAQGQTLPARAQAVNVANLQTRNSVNTVQGTGSHQLQQIYERRTSTPAPTPATPTPTPPPVLIAYAGGFKSTNGHGTATGFSDQTPNGSTTYANGSLSDGTFTATLGNGATVSVPLAPLGTSFGPAGTTPLGPVYGVTYMMPDSTFWFGYLIPANQPDEREFIYGGTPVAASFYQPEPTTQLYTFGLLPDIAAESPIPYTLAQYGGDVGNPTVSPLYVVAPANSAFGSYNPTTNPDGTAARMLQASLAIDGQGASQSSTLVINTGAFFTSSATGTVVGSGPVRGSFQPDSNFADQVRIASAASTMTDGNGNALYGGNTVEGFVLDQNSYNTSQNPVSQLASALPFGEGSPTQYGFAQVAIGGPSSIGTTRTSQTQTGWFGGVMYPQSTDISPYVLSGGAKVITNAATNSVSAAFTGSDPFTAESSGIGSMNIYFGSTSGRSYARTAFIDDDLFGAAESSQTPSQINGNNLPLPDQANSPQIAMVSSGVVPTTFTGVDSDGNPVPVTPCSCQYLKWGYWTGQLNQVDDDGNITRSDRAFINTWVVGQPTPQLDLNNLISQSAVGNYTGAAIGSVFNNGASYIAAGNLSAQYNFATQTGSFQISNFDGHNFAASGAAPLSGANYSFSAANSGYSMAVNGTFYGPNAAETGGNFAVHATEAPYFASGIFAGKR